uniref:Uncharacterized protein n=1 Tax=Malus domestica TaxID=3750 RepID=E4Z8P2_MALDO|nr:hypothetical protein [Malus domestica]
MRLTPLPASSEISLRGPNLSGTQQLIHCINLRAAINIKSHIEKKISKCPLEDLALLKEDLPKLVSTIDNLNVDSSLLRVKIAELMVASIEYYSLHVVSLKKLNPKVKAQHLAIINLSIAQVWSSQQATSEDFDKAQKSDEEASNFDKTQKLDEPFAALVLEIRKSSESKMAEERRGKVDNEVDDYNV